MARPLILELVGDLYYVTSRGVRRENIYENDGGREKWFENLGNTCRRFNGRCHADLFGGYTLKETGDYFGKHDSTISRIVKAGE